MKRKKRASTKTNINRKLSDSEIDEEFQGLASAMKKTVKEADLSAELAKLYRQDPINAEIMLAAKLKEIGRSILDDSIGFLDDKESSLPNKGKGCRKT